MMLPITWMLALAAAHAQVTDIDFGGAVQTDVRYRPHALLVGPWYQPLGRPPGFTRNENRFEFDLGARTGKASAVADVDLVVHGFAEGLDDLDALSSRSQVDPWHLEMHGLYLDVWDVLMPGLDLRIGQQLVQWGAGDQFNPTNNLNADDLEDSLRFGEQIGNVMLRADYSPTGNWALSGVIVPIFKPALLPGTSELGIAAVDRMPFNEEELRWQITAEQALSTDLLGYPAVAVAAQPQLPSASLENMQYALQLGGTLGLHDLAVSYYHGRSDIPQAIRNYTTQRAIDACNPNDAEDCISGLLETEVTLAYPRMDVVGFNAAGEVNPLALLSDTARAIGYRMEVALIFPEHTDIAVENEELDFGLIVQPAGEYDYGLPNGARPTVVADTPFAKWVLGLDYTFTRHIYANAQWVHGLNDEFGAGDFLQPGEVVRQSGVTSDIAETSGCIAAKDGSTCTRELLRPRLGDYLVLGTDVRISDTLFRLFTIVDLLGMDEEQWDADLGKRVRVHHGWLSEQGRSMVIYPEVQQNLGSGVQLATGVVLMVGEPTTKFGDPAAGGTQIFARGRYSF